MSRQTASIGGGFFHHGVATPVSNHRGTVATADGVGRDVVLVWLFDHTGGYALLSIDAETGAANEEAMPFPSGGDCPFASVLSSRNRYYTHFNGHFAEYDPEKGKFTFHHESAAQMAMSMTEDDGGCIWAATYPNSGVVKFDPDTSEFVDYGHVYEQNWRQYPRSVAADDSGWIYFGIGNTLNQLIALDPDTGRALPLIPDQDRRQGAANVYRDLDGRVYAELLSGSDTGDWLELYQGTSRVVETPPHRLKPIISGSQDLFHREFPSGRRLDLCDLVERRLVVSDPITGEQWERSFDYSSQGARIMGVERAPDESICGGTMFPMRFFRFDPSEDAWINRASYHQWNTVARQGDRFFAGAYPGGILLEWDPDAEWVPTEKGDPACNPLFLDQAEPSILRPHCLLAHPDGRRIIMGGTPEYGHTGGGLLVWDRESGTSVLFKHTELLPQHAPMSLVALTDNTLLVGSTTSPGTGGEQRAAEAELYIFNLNAGEVVWREPVFAGAQEFTALWKAPSGRVYGFADRQTFFVFDPGHRKIVHRQETDPTCHHQGPRIFVSDDEGTVYILFEEGVGRIQNDTFAIEMLALTPVPVTAGGAYLHGRIYFANGSQLYSYRP